MPYQDNWRLCNGCRGVFRPPDRKTKEYGVCKSGGKHHWDFGGYALFYSKGDNGEGQSDWRSCKKCSILFFDGHSSAGVCPAGGEHDSAKSENYVIKHSHHKHPRPPNNWYYNFRWCCKCEQLFLPDWRNVLKPVCPNALVKEHDIYCGSGYYDLLPESILWI